MNKVAAQPIRHEILRDKSFKVVEQIYRDYEQRKLIKKRTIKELLK